MRMPARIVSLFVLMCAPVLDGQGAIIWSGPDVTFTKANGADFTLAENQDRLTAVVWLTRGSAQGLFNIHEETFFSRGTSPLDTTWAFTGLAGNPSESDLVTAANYSALAFSDFTTALEGRVGLGIVGTKGVLHLVSEDIYVDITFDEWSMRNNGFSYTRSSVSPVPELGAYGLAAAVFCLIGAIANLSAHWNPRAPRRYLSKSAKI